MEINFLKWPFEQLKRLDNEKSSWHSLSQNVRDKHLGVLADEEEVHPISPDDKLNFSDYSTAVCDTIRASDRKFTVGIFSDWGTGKTTLMRLMEKNLRTIVCKTAWYLHLCPSS
jgi:KAP family P-loop domain